MTQAFLIRIEGCNFAATIDDTGNLSTIRGASLAHLRLADRWPQLLAKAGLANVTPIVIGASDGIYRVETTDTIPDIRKKIAEAISAPPLAGNELDNVRPHLTFSSAVIEEGSKYRDDVLRLMALCRAEQLQQPTVDLPPAVAATKGPCFVDRVRPADCKGYWMPEGARDVSSSVKMRREYGRTARQAFYKSELGFQPAYDFANSFAELVTENPPGLPPGLESKMAVVYLDGNKFTAIRENVVFSAQAGGTVPIVRKRQHDFSEFVRGKRQKLLRAILDRLEKQPRMLYKPKRAKDEDPNLDRLKFETLLWGGDESLFVLPAWALMDLLPVLAAELEGSNWQHPSGYKLSHAVGIAICSIKMPIAIAKRHAQEVADAAKPLAKNPNRAKADQLKKLSNVFSLQIFESIEPPRAGLGAFREHLYGTKASEAFTMTGAVGVTGMLDLIRKFQASPGGLPRSQLFKLLNAARAENLLAKGKQSEAEVFIGVAKPAEKKVGPVELALERSKSALTVGDFRSDVLGYTSDAPLLPLIRLAELWDYVDPLGPA